MCGYRSCTERPPKLVICSVLADGMFGVGIDWTDGADEDMTGFRCLSPDDQGRVSQSFFGQARLGKEFRGDALKVLDEEDNARNTFRDCDSAKTINEIASICGLFCFRRVVHSDAKAL